MKFITTILLFILFLNVGMGVGEVDAFTLKLPDFIAKKLPKKHVLMKKPTLYQISIGGLKFKVEVARTREDHEKGLSGRTSLDSNQGMLFVFPKEDVYAFWMKDMKLPLDIVWIGKNKKILGYVQRVQPDSYPAVYKSSSMILYALEVPAGFIERHSLSIGEKVNLSKIPKK